MKNNKSLGKILNLVFKTSLITFLSIIPVLSQPDMTQTLNSKDKTTEPYLMAVSFYSPIWMKLKPADLKAINESPYNGVAIPLLDEDKNEPIPTLTELVDKTKAARASCTKDLWPWVNMNRIIEFSNRHSLGLTNNNNPYYANIHVIDLDNKTGALEDYYYLYRLALQLAKQTGAPGIVVDLEVYNNYNLYSLVDMAKALKLPPDVVVEKLEAIGHVLGRITAETYPNAILWHFFTGVCNPNYSHENGKGYYRSVGYVVFGILQYAKEHNVPLRVIDGGETNLNYYSPTVENLESKINKAAEKLKPTIEKYPGEIVAGGTIAPWYEAKKTSDYMVQWADSAGAPYKTINDFVPVMAKLFESYDYVWIYGALAAPYNPFDVESSSRYNPAIVAALKEAREFRKNNQK